jgi:hypothetical protein
LLYFTLPAILLEKVYSNFMCPVVQKQISHCLICVVTNAAHDVSRVLDRIAWVSTSNLWWKVEQQMWWVEVVLQLNLYHSHTNIHNYWNHIMRVV